MSVKIIDIATANPVFKLSQKRSLQILRTQKKLSRRENILYKKFLLDKGIETRYFAVSGAEEFFIADQDCIIRRFQNSAAALSVDALEKCIKRSCIAKDNIDHLAVGTCTGYLCPGLSSYVIEKARLRRDIYGLDIVGMGCGAALPVLRAAYNFLNTHKDSNAIALLTEICSSAIFWKDDPELILSNSIFGDGSASCLLTNRETGPGLRILDFVSEISPGDRDKLRFVTENSRLRNVIKGDVPDIAALLLKKIVHAILERNGLARSEVSFWAIHPGGRKILDKAKEAMDFSEKDLSYSRNVMRRYGNMSSPTILYVLKDILESGLLKKGDKVIVAAFGAGFSGHAALLSYE